MKSAEDWAKEFAPKGEGWGIYADLVRCIQDDAVIAERERCAKLCETFGFEAIWANEIAAKIREEPK